MVTTSEHFLPALQEQILRQFPWELLPHSPYSLNLAPSKICLFSKVERTVEMHNEVK